MGSLGGMRVIVKGYKCYDEEGEIDLGKITILMGPMGGGKSSLLEALAICGRIMSGEVSSEDNLFKGPLAHLSGLHLEDLINKNVDKMEISVLSSGEGGNGIKMIYFPDGRVWGISLIISNDERKITEELVNLEILRDVIRVLRDIAERGEVSKETLDNVRTHINENSLTDLIKSPDLREDLNRILNLRSLSYVSFHRPSQRELSWGRETLLPSLKEYLGDRWSSDGLSLIPALTSLLFFRIKNEGKIKKLEDILRNLGICDSTPCIEPDFTDGNPTIKVKTRRGELDIRNLSSGERNCLLIALAAVQTEKGLFIMEEPEIGISTGTLSKLLPELYHSLELNLLISTHSLIPFSAIRNSILSSRDSRISFSDISLYYVNYPYLMKIKVDERGVPSLLPEKYLPEQLQKDIEILRSALFLERRR
jgi:energy-coupling factor transporter ATP-binding protein EcfA2